MKTENEVTADASPQHNVGPHNEVAADDSRPAGSNQQFADQDVQDRLDASRDDIRYEPLTIAPSIVNTASTNNVPETIFADYYSKYKWWESDVVLQGQGAAVALDCADTYQLGLHCGSLDL